MFPHARTAAFPPPVHVASIITFYCARYQLATELEDALEHALDEGINTKVLLRGGDAGPF